MTKDIIPDINACPAPKLSVTNVSKVFSVNQGERTALADVSFKIKTGNVATVIGPTGCGKTTLLNLVAGFERASSGQVLMDGEPIEQPGPDRGFMFQRPTLLPWLKLRQNVAFPIRYGRGRHQGRRIKRTGNSLVEQYLKLVGLEDASELYPHQMSGGMQSRAALARLLIVQSPILLMDEPFGALDAQTRLTMQKMLMGIVQGSESTTVLFITHDVEEALLISDDVYVMSSSPGRIVRHVEVPFREKAEYQDIVSDSAFTQLKYELIDLLQGSGDLNSANTTAYE